MTYISVGSLRGLLIAKRCYRFYIFRFYTIIVYIIVLFTVFRLVNPTGVHCHIEILNDDQW